MPEDKKDKGDEWPDKKLEQKSPDAGDIPLSFRSKERNKTDFNFRKHQKSKPLEH